MGATGLLLSQTLLGKPFHLGVGMTGPLTLQARVDHKNGTVHFGGLKAESDQIRDHIAVLAQRLSKACAMIAPASDAQLDSQRLQVLTLKFFKCPVLTGRQHPLEWCIPWITSSASEGSYLSPPSDFLLRASPSCAHEFVPALQGACWYRRYCCSSYPLQDRRCAVKGVCKEAPKFLIPDEAWLLHAWYF